jgi:hypothetical protein
MQGLDIRQNEMNWTAVRLHYSADPSKDAKWFDEARRFFPDENQWQAEFEVNWFVTQGTRVFPEFSETMHTRPVEWRRRKVVYRAWDFGWHAPACLLGQIDEKDRLVLQHEVIGREETTRDFAIKVIQRCAEWYPMNGPGFVDYCDPAGQQAQPAAEKSEVRDVEVLQTLGITPSWEHGWARKDGRALIHQLLRVRSDGTPGLFVDAPGCPILLQAFLGKFCFPESRDGRVAEEPDERLHPWSDIMASLRYLVTGLHPALGLTRYRSTPVAQKKVNYHGYGVPIGRR